MLVHSGMFDAAQYVLSQLRETKSELREKSILSEALSRFEGYTLVTTGHSLGAGTAAVLAFLLRPDYPDTVCYAYSPPCAFNAPAAEAAKAFTTSVTFGNEVIARLSVPAVLRLTSRMRAALEDCKLPKYQGGNSIELFSLKIVLNFSLLENSACTNFYMPTKIWPTLQPNYIFKKIQRICQKTA